MKTSQRWTTIAVSVFVGLMLGIVLFSSKGTNASISSPQDNGQNMVALKQKVEGMEQRLNQTVNALNDFVNIMKKQVEQKKQPSITIENGENTKLPSPPSIIIESIPNLQPQNERLGKIKDREKACIAWNNGNLEVNEMCQKANMNINKWRNDWNELDKKARNLLRLRNFKDAQIAIKQREVDWYDKQIKVRIMMNEIENKKAEVKSRVEQTYPDARWETNGKCVRLILD